MLESKTSKQLEILINNGKYKSKEEMLEKLDVFLMGDRISPDEYQYLVSLLGK